MQEKNLSGGRAERRLGEMMKEVPKATGNEFHGGVSETPPVPTLASQGIDKNLANRAMTSKRVDADWVGQWLKLDCSFWELVRAWSCWR
jgi:hypothetical protein